MAKFYSGFMQAFGLYFPWDLLIGCVVMGTVDLAALAVLVFAIENATGDPAKRHLVVDFFALIFGAIGVDGFS